MGAIRAGLAFQLKASVGEAYIRERENDLFRRAIARWEHNPNIVVLGSHDAERLAIVSFMIKHDDRFLHYNYGMLLSPSLFSVSFIFFFFSFFSSNFTILVSVLLNDLFGIQSRGGCACAGPYGQKVLGIDFTTAKKFEAQLIADDDNEFLRPGFVRINFNYFMEERIFQFVLDAVEFIANEGWKFMPYYQFYQDTGEWIHKRNKKYPFPSLLTFLN